jgi:putative membrane protein
MWYDNYYWGMNPVWWVLWLIFLIWIFAIPYDIPGQRRSRADALDILKKRLASGEITEKEYEEKKAILRK